MARRSQSSSQGDNPLDPNYLPPHYKEYYRLALDLLAEEGQESYHRFLAEEAAPDFLCPSEVEHITQHLQKPQYACQEAGGSTDSSPPEADTDGSSGTYWPMNSDLAVPELDLGWPMVFGFRGTEVTTLVQPPPPDNPSIKEEARRMIRAAQQVIAIVMDVFTDVDLLSEVLEAAARRVPVYILLDEMHAQLFLDMAAKCRVNLNFVEFLRVRTVSGPTYYCRTGMSFKGHVKEKFLLVDCMVVLSGSYSFMWSFEKIHRSIAHIFQGELVASFDEEFRILFAQSDPLVPPSNVLVRTETPVGPYGMAPFGNNNMMPFFPKKPQLLLPREDSLFSPFVDRIDPDRYFLSSLRRDDMMRHTLEGSAMRMYSKKMEMENCQADPLRGYLRSKQLEMDSFKRHSFAEGTFENFQSTKQFSKQLYMNNLDEFKIQSSHFQKDQFYQYQFEHPHGANRPQGLFERIRGGRLGFNEPEDYADGFRCPELESGLPQDGYPLRLDYVPSNASKEVRHGSDHLNPGGNGLLGLPSLRRQNMGQKFMCQTSPTQKQSTEQRLFLHDQGPDGEQDKKVQENRAGLRNWRISSYLSGYQSDPGEDGLPMPMESEGHNEGLGPPEPLARYPSDLLPTFKPPLPLPNAKDISGTERLPEETSVVKQDPFRSRINPLIQRSSRLRSSLIFSAAKLDQPNSSAEKVQMVHKEQTSTEMTKEAETIKAGTVSKVAELLEKYKSVGKDSQSTTLSHTKAVSAFLQEESQNAGRKGTTSVQYKILESRVLDSKDSFSPYKLHPESGEPFGASASATDPAGFHGGNKAEKLASRFYPADQPGLPPEKESLIFVGETPKCAIADRTESVPARGGDGSEAEVPKPAPAPVGTLSSRNQGSDSSLSKPDEESGKQEQSPREFFRRGSLKLKQLLSPKAEKKPEEEAGLEGWKPEKLSAGAPLKRAPRCDSQEVIEEEKSPKLPAPGPALRPNPAPQPRLPSSAANVLYSSNLRDDTKVILEQISAHSQKNRAEVVARQLPAASNPEVSRSTTSLDRKGDERNTGIGRSESFGSHKRGLQREASEDRDSLLKRMESMRKEKRVYSRFEVFCKKEEQGGEEEYEADAKDKKMGKFMPKLLGSFKTKK
ncbi:protein FAM83H [Erythrolamprus reginae]|uniref:protein FAM83H n=1 Tax=Erythrolamprus reginae TaxID=121349 RepID=UPI00396C6D89